MSPKGSNRRNRRRFPRDGESVVTDREGCTPGGIAAQATAGSGMSCRRCRAAGRGEGPVRHLGHLILLAGIVLSVTTLAGSCGLETVPYLAPPIASTPTQAPLAAYFTNDTANDVDYFSGYEVYYRFYTSPAAALNDQTTIQNSSTPGVALLTSLGYRRIVPAKQAFNGPPIIPLIPFDTTAVPPESSKAFQITLDFDFNYADKTPDDATASWKTSTQVGTSSPVTLKRNTNNSASNNSSAYKSFFVDDYTASTAPTPDGDISGTYDGTSDLYLVLVALAYGTDITTLQPVYSTPVLLVTNSALTYFTLQVSSLKPPS